MQKLEHDDGCIEIMTGAVLPDGADCVIPVERISIEDGAAQLEDGYAPEPRQFVHPRGSDYAAGQAVLTPGRRITAMDIAVIASCGMTRVEVARLPRIRVVSTGNELVPPGRPIEAHQIRLSNGPAVVAMLRAAGCDDVAHEHLADDESVLASRLGELLDACDLLILSGGVSMGKADFVPGVLAQLGVREIFHKVSQRPGKPLWFGSSSKDRLVFALPGNPVSTLVCCRQYVLPALSLAAGAEESATLYAELSENVTFNPALTCFLPVRTAVNAEGKMMATPVPTNTSGDFAALSGTDGYVELDWDRNEFAAGTCVPLHRWSAY